MGPTFYPINSPLINYFFYPSPLQAGGPNYPLANGFIFFYADEDHTVQLPTYSDVFSTPVLNTNPIQLGAAGECPLFYLENRLYYIVITDSSGDQMNPITTISHYNPANSSQIPTGGSNNLLANGQFNYPIEFWQENSSNSTGLIISSATNIAWGWEFLQDVNTTSVNYVTFNPVSNISIEGNPVFETILQTANVMTGEQTKDFRSIFGNATFYEGQPVTFSAQMRSLLSGNIQVNLLLEINYGVGSISSAPVSLTTFTVTPTREKFVYSFIIPSIIGNNVTEGSYLAIHVQPGLGQATNFGITNVLMSVGTVSNPIYVQDSYSDEVAQILGATTQISQAGLGQNYSSYYYNNGTIFPYAATGNITLIPDVISSPTPITIPPFSVICQGGSLLISGYTNGIPNARLYSIIGNTFGSGGDFSVTSNANVVTFNSIVGARELSPYSAQSAPVTVFQVQIGLRGDITAVLTSPTVVTVTWIENFAPVQTTSTVDTTFNPAPPNGLFGNWFYYGSGSPNPNNANPTGSNNFIEVDTVNAGSGIAQASATITFKSENIAAYETQNYTGNQFTKNFFEYAVFSNNTRPTYQSGTTVTDFTADILFTVDGNLANRTLGLPSYNRFIIPFLSTNSLAQNLSAFVNTINNPFIWNVTVNSTPSASEYFFASSTNTDFAIWFKVDGIGTAPSVGRTNIEVDISSAYNTTQVASAIAAATNNLTFNVPAEADLPALVMDSLVHWYINL